MPHKWIFEDWPEDAVNLEAECVIEMYNKRFAGALHQPEEVEALRAKQQDAASVAREFGFVGKGKGKLVVPFVTIPKGALPGPAQTTGDCVSRNVVTACLVTVSTEAASGDPDEHTGIIEEFPKVSAVAMQNNAFSCETVYGDRGHGGQGASCARLVRNVTEWGGIVLRQNYPDADVDLTRYNASIGSRWGGRGGTPDYFHNLGKQHQIKESVECDSFEAIADFLAAGYGISTCGGEGFSSTRDGNGVSRRRGGWSHAMGYAGTDDRDSIKKIYGEPLVLVQNSWGVWNSGPRKILGTDILIPEGSFWARWSDVKNRYCQALSGAHGWKPKDITWTFDDSLWG